MHLETAQIVRHDRFTGDYRLLALAAGRIAPEVQPGQFVHVRLPRPSDAILRRPFSVFKAGGGELQILYKAVGRGTVAMLSLEPGDTVSLIGPLGNGFPPCPADRFPVLVAGGYGMAALYLFARRAAAPGLAFFGGKAAGDILCVHEFRDLGWEVRIATEDGSLGDTGLVTEALDRWLAGERGGRAPEFFGCGPNGMLRAVGRRAAEGGWKAWLSMDRNMGCGVGACLTCVQKIRTPNGGWEWLRVCREGPVFESRAVVWEDE